LRQLGADIQYLEKEKFPPLKISGTSLKGGKLEINADKSSQFISAMLLISPGLTSDLELDLKGKVVSRPYINMTIELLRLFGINAEQYENNIKISKQDLNFQLSTFNSQLSTLNSQLSTLNSQLSTYKIE